MPAERIGMRDAREIIRLKSSSVSTHEIAPARHGPIDRAGDVEADGRGRPVLASVGGHERPGAGGGALRQNAAIGGLRSRIGPQCIAN